MPAEAAHSILLKKENAHDDPIYCCAWTKTNTGSGDTKVLTDFIVTGGLDCLIKIWTLVNNKLELLHTLKGHSMAVVSVAVSPDGHTLASTSLDCTLMIWDMTSGQKVHEMQTGATDIWKVIFSPDGSKVVSGSHTGKIFIFSVEKGEKERVLDTRGRFAVSVAWSPDGRYIASGAVDGAVCIFDVAQGKLLHTIEAHTKLVRSVAFNPKSTQLVTASQDNCVKIFDVASAGLQASLELKSWAVSVCVSPDGHRVAIAAGDGSVRVVLSDGLKPLHTFNEHTDTSWGASFNAEGTKLVSVSKDRSINVYECPIVLPPKNPPKTEILIK
ncbi:WD domain, g-beta repeat domain-containing protein [Phthorimaea operculella]|nr:WD domain, g-beta repeat domain-containing protein [Phthorimaea operculella]